MAWKRALGLKGTARNPSTIANQQHHDKSNAERDISGSPGTVDRIISTSATLQFVENHRVLRVANTNAAWQYLFIGEEADAPGGAPDISNGIAIPPNFYENIYLGELESTNSIFIKSSSNDVQIVVMES